mgnify:CR=1 FL=1|tara:strand:+ start:540 stop:701 length:162 start_codon:yes stop_codon:yes gene_type:complete
MFHNQKITIRLNSKIIEEVELILEEDKGDRYNDISHFIRCSIMKLVREEGGDL